MGVFSAILLAFAAQGSPQDTPEPKSYSLNWTFHVGQKREFAWAGSFTIKTTPVTKDIPSGSISYELNGTFTVDKVEDDGSAVGTLSFHRQVWKGKMGDRATDIEIENSQLKKPEGTLTEEGQKHFSSMLTPVAVRLTRRGHLEATKPHPTFSGGIWPLMIGPILPSKKKMTVGHGWIAKLLTPEMKAAGEAGLDLEYQFSEMTEINGRACARVVSKLKQFFRYQGIDTTISLKTDGLFDPVRGECVHDHYEGELTGEVEQLGQKHQLNATFRVDFSTLPPRKH